MSAFRPSQAFHKLGFEGVAKTNSSEMRHPDPDAPLTSRSRGEFAF
jgi:hypothetical protein